MGDINIYNSYIKATSQGDGAVIGSAKNCTGGNIKNVNSTVDAQSTKDNVYGSGTGAAIILSSTAETSRSPTCILSQSHNLAGMS